MDGMWPRFDRPRPALAVAIGVALTVAAVVVIAVVADDVASSIPALILVVPVVIAAVLGGRWAAFIVAAVATIAFIFAVEPIGSPSIHLTEDVVALFVFSAVAFLVSALVTTRVQTLQHIDEQRRALLRSVSHDLRTPLAAIHAVATDLRAGDVYDEATRAALLDLLIAETERLDRLVANLLSMSRIETGTLRPDITAVDVAELVDECTHRMRELSSEWPLTVDIPRDLPLVAADHAQLGEIVSNLLDNATRHTPRGTAVSVRASLADDEKVLVTIADSGPGLPAAVLDRVTNNPRDPSGGLGLPICHAIAEANGASLAFGDQRPGTSITIALERSH